MVDPPPSRKVGLRMQLDHVEYEVEGEVGVITLNRPAVVHEATGHEPVSLDPSRRVPAT